MVFDKGYKCNKCKMIYHNSIKNLPIYCKKCGENLVSKRYLYNLTKDYYGNNVETKETNIFGGYDYIKTKTAELAIPVKIKRKFFRWYEV